MPGTRTAALRRRLTRLGTTRPRMARLRMARLRAAGDAGLTLIELVVTMSVMAVFMSMFTVATQQMFRSANGTEALSVAQAQLNNAFLRLDREVRYAAGISGQGMVGADWYVEFLTTSTGVPVCSQLRLHAATEQLQHRTWTQGAGTPSPTPWIPLASAVTSALPFTATSADAVFGFQRLRLRLTAHSGSGQNGASTQTDLTFTALNTSLSTASDSICTEGRSVP